MNSFWNNLPRPFFVLAPMEAVTDVVFRHVVRRAGPPDVFFTEFANATGWVHAGDKAIRGRLIKTDDEHPIVAQIWGGEPGDMETFAKHCATLGYDGVDINMGCPAKSAIKSGGSVLIRKPEVAVAAIAAAKTAGLPVSVKTRLGYTYVEEWREWIATLLQQDIAALTIHLRTKKEMSKVPAHYELIGDLVALRDEIAPRTLLIINGDIRDREHGEQLARENPGVDGFMIGRGVFHDPFCFTACTKRVRGGESHEASAARVQPAAYASETRHEVASSDSVDENNTARKQQLLDLLRLHLDLYDQWHDHTDRPYETLKRFYKIYIRDFDGASDLRHQLMQTKSTDEVRAILDSKNI